MRYSVFDANDNFVASVDALNIEKAYQEARAAGLIPRGAHLADAYSDGVVMRSKSGELVARIEVDQEAVRHLREGSHSRSRDFPRHSYRHNPPLPEHMAHNKLEDIAELLATRIIAETMTGRNGVFILGDFIYELSSQIRIQLRYAGVEGGYDDRALDLLTASEKVCSLFKDNGPLARMFPQHVGRSVVR